MGGYIPSSDTEKAQMLSYIGCTCVDDLFVDVPKEVRVKTLNLPEGISELELREEMESVAAKNTVFRSIFRGAGAYFHYIPSIVKTVTSKEEFLTAYTPYQAEISQGILQSIFEYQTMMCELTGLDVSNASVYDGATAAAEAVMMCQERRRSKVILSGATNPQVIRTVQTYCEGKDIPVEILPVKDGMTDVSALKGSLDDQTACVYIQQPNFYGILEEAESIGEMVHEAGAKFIMGCNPISLGMLKTPGECHADIAVGEGQPLGMPLAFGGPYLGFVTCAKDMMRKIPGRVVGQTTDHEGRRAFVLTLQAREQHIRREKASSNICSNQALCAMTASVYLAAMGPDGLLEVAQQCTAKAHYAAEQIASVDGFALVYDKPFFHEFVTNCPIDKDCLTEELAKRGILSGLPVDEGILWCVTEMNSKAQIDKLVDILREVCVR